MRVPFGVVGIIYEARPNVTVDVAVLALKSGNAVVLRGGSAAMSTNTVLVDVIRGKEMDRMLVCAAEDCDAVVLDLSRNRSKRYCDTGNCANRAHVAAYRARKAAS